MTTNLLFYFTIGSGTKSLFPPCELASQCEPSCCETPDFDGGLIPHMQVVSGWSRAPSLKAISDQTKPVLTVAKEGGGKKKKNHLQQSHHAKTSRADNSKRSLFKTGVVCWDGKLDSQSWEGVEGEQGGTNARLHPGFFTPDFKLSEQTKVSVRGGQTVGLGWVMLSLATTWLCGSFHNLRNVRVHVSMWERRSVWVAEERVPDARAHARASHVREGAVPADASTRRQSVRKSTWMWGLSHVNARR